MISSCPVLLISAVNVMIAMFPFAVRALKERIGIFKSIRIDDIFRAVINAEFQRLILKHVIVQ